MIFWIDNLVRVKNVVVIDVADLAHGVAHDLRNRNDAFQWLFFGQTWNRDLATDDNDVAFGVGFAGDATMSILLDAGVEHGV